MGTLYHVDAVDWVYDVVFCVIMKMFTEFIGVIHYTVFYIEGKKDSAKTILDQSVLADPDNA